MKLKVLITDIKEYVEVNDYSLYTCITLDGIVLEKEMTSKYNLATCTYKYDWIHERID